MFKKYDYTVLDYDNIVRSLSKNVDSLFSANLPSKLSEKTFIIPVDIEYDKEKSRVLLSIDIPGVKVEDLTITNETDMLVLETKRKEKTSTIRIKKLPNYDYSHAESQLIDGVLTIVVPEIKKLKQHIEVHSTSIL